MMYFEQYLNTLSMLLKKLIIKEGKSKHKRKHQKEGNKKCGPKRKVELVDKFF